MGDEIERMDEVDLAFLCWGRALPLQCIVFACNKAGLHHVHGLHELVAVAAVKRLGQP